MRNYSALEWEPQAGLNVLVGANAQGKSNLLEAIALLATGKSFRTVREREVIAHGLPSAALSGEATVAAGSVRLSCTLGHGATGLRKLYTVNGSKVRYAAYLGRVRVVSFVPADLGLVSGPPASRRSLLNAALAQESPAYYGALAAYSTYLAQKNALLRAGDAPDETLLATYDERLVEAGTALVLARHAFVTALAERASSAHRAWVGEAEGTLDVTYAADVPCDVPTHDGVAAAFVARLAAKRGQERARGVALVGPHRDDVRFSLGGVPLEAFGSQGQQRTAVLALKTAEFGVLRARSGDAPLLLLDDVLSELDAQRQRAFLGGLGDVGQAFVTTTHPVAREGATTYRVDAGRLQRVAGAA